MGIFDIFLTKKVPVVTPNVPQTYNPPLKIAIINACSVLTDAQVTPVVNALQIQVSRDFAPVYGIDAKLIQVMKGQATPTGMWQLILMDTSDEAGCFTGDTKISLLDGTEKTMKELAENYHDKTFWVYSYDLETKSIVPGLAHSPRITKQTNELVEVTLNNGEIIKCTPDHRFLLRNGTYKEAQFLVCDDNIMPLYRKLSDLQSKHNKMIGYELIHAGNTEIFTHRISDSLTNIGTCLFCGTQLPNNKHSIRHHKDFNKRNNNPDNIQWMTWKEHQIIHNNHLVVQQQDPIFKEKTKRAAIRNLIAWNVSEEGREKARTTILNSHKTDALNPKVFVKELHKNGKLPGFAKYNKSEEHRKITSQTASLYQKYKKYLKHNSLKKEELPFQTFKKQEQNHSVISVKKIQSTCDVYDITVEKYHNFALTSGVFVHNSLGYHDLTSDGLPLGKCFIKTDMENGAIWSVTVSHELVEMLGDANCNLTVFDQSTNTKGILYAFETADACEADQYAYDINGVKVSDFVYPAWFGVPGSKTKFDHMGHITHALQLLPGGYIGKFDVRTGSGWTQITAEKILHEHRNNFKTGSRRDKRSRGQSSWKKSTR